jgi:predicted ATPase/DNA-binding SARP family transcriptional activator
VEQLVDVVGHGSTIERVADDPLTPPDGGSWPYARGVLQIALLGPLEATRDGQPVPVPAGKSSELLVRLALEPGGVVGADRLVDDLWQGATTRRNTLQAKVTMLRRALGDPPAVTSRDGGYTLSVEPAHVDAWVALENAAIASQLLHTGDNAAAADLCESTLQLYRGDLLPAAGDGEWVAPHRARLGEARLSLIETRLSALLKLGDADVIGELEAEVAAHPFQEGLWELLIVALYRTGRQADALAAYQRVKASLAAELGLDPGLQLQRLEQQILTQDATLGSASQAGRGGRDRVSGNLPSMSADLIGREEDLEVLARLLSSERLVEIVGPGGIGKTAVAVAVGRNLSPDNADTPWTGGVWLARLETATTDHEVVDTLVAAMGGPGGEAALLERLRGSAAVVILDNCEHVLDAAAALALRILDAAPSVKVLCTSQVPLGVSGETVFDLAPLEVHEAVELFTRRAKAQRLLGSAAEHDDHVLRLCRSLDGLPLAIELAAARTKTLSIEEITRRLDDPFAVLSDPTSRRPERRRSLRSTIEWSYDLLFPDDQRGLWALATFAGGASLPAVEFVIQALDVPAAAAIDVVGRLVNRSLVIVDDEVGRVPSHQVRYRLLDSIRAFAHQAMTDAGLTDRARAAHAAWFAEAAASSTSGVRSADQAEYLSFARAERANIDAALAWSATSDPVLALHLANGFGWAWVVLGDSRGAQRLLTALKAAENLGEPQDRADALLLAGWIEASTGDLEPAREHVAAATELAERIGDVELQARCYYYLAYVVSHHGEFVHAMELTDRSRAIYDGLDQPWHQVANGLFASRAAISAADVPRSVEAADWVQHWLRMVEDPWLRVRSDAMLGELARLEHRFAEAVDHIGRAAEASRAHGFQQTEAYQVSSLGRAQCQAGDYETGAATLVSAIDKAQATGDVRLAALARVHLGRVLRARGEQAQARQALESADDWHRQAGGGEQAALGTCLLAAMDAADQVPDAEARLTAVLADARSDGAAHVEVFALDALARAAAARGDRDTAHDFLEAAELRMAAASHFITDLDRTDAHWVRSVD